MRSHLVIIALFFPIVVALSQTSSTRLSGMGNISIAVIDTESEAFSNPAKAMWVGTGFFRLNPYYFGTSNDFSENSNSTLPSYSPYNTSTSTSNAQYGMPVGIIIPVSNLRLGAVASADGATLHEEDKNFNGGGYPSSSNSTYDIKSPSTSLTLLAAVDVGWGSLGAIGSWNGNTTKTESSYNYPLETPATSSDSKYETVESNHAYGLGVSFGSIETAQVSLAIDIEGYHDESKATSSIYNGIPQDLSQPDVTIASSSGPHLIGELRKLYDGGIVAGIRMSYRGQSIDQSEKYNWYDATAMFPLYGERTTGHFDQNQYSVGFGISKMIESAGIISFEYVYSPTDTHSEYFEPTSGTYPDGRVYYSGDRSSTSDEKAHQQEVRIGAELHITSELVARGGLEVMWSSYRSDSQSSYSAGTNSVSGETSAHYYGAGGFSYTLGSVRIDYSFGMTPTYQYYSGSSGVSMNDVILQHSATVSFQF